MDELDDYGSFNTRYEGVGKLVYLPGEPVHVYFEVRQLSDGRLLIACVSPSQPIPENPIMVDGHLVSGEPFSTMWGRGIREIYRSEGVVNRAHYVASMTRVRYSSQLQPDDHSIKLALHNFIPGPRTDVSKNSLKLSAHGYDLTISPVGNYRQQEAQLLRYGGNLRTSWVEVKLTDDNGNRPFREVRVPDLVEDMLNPISLALGTLVTCPQTITFDAEDNRNDVEHYSSPAAAYSSFIPTKGWDSPITETIEAWFSKPAPQLLTSEEVAVCIRQHLDACATDIYLETRALAAATLLDVMAGRYARVWAPQVQSKDISFRDKLNRLLGDLNITIPAKHLKAVIKARNSLVHSGSFVTSEQDKTFSEYRNLLLLGRSILLHLAGFSNKLHDGITD
jgi:hypothetical protein